MYHAHRYSLAGWAGEPEVDPTLDYAEREQIEGWELTPMATMEMAYGGVLRQKDVLAGSSTACMLTLNSSSGLLRAAKYVFESASHSPLIFLVWVTVVSPSSVRHL